VPTLPPETPTEADPDAWTTARQAADDIRLLLARLGADRALVAAVTVWHDLARTTVCVHIPALPPNLARALAAAAGGAV
jgi:pimeloyl-ACP methyl ester carboxylesterase